MEYSIGDLQKFYDIDLNGVVQKIKKQRAKIVLLQFPDGLKPHATFVVDYLEKKTGAEFLIWMGSCFGACDVPVLGGEIEKKIDLVVQFGHNEKMPSY